MLNHGWRRNLSPDLARRVMRFALAGMFSLAAIVCILDGVQFHGAKRGEYLTPWYQPQWWKAPYTHLTLSLYESREYWKNNADGSERWRVREVTVGRTVFWTALERIPLDPAL